MSMIVVVDETRCLSCDTCMFACALAHSRADSLGEAIESGEALQSRIFLSSAGSSGIPIMCHHCDDAPCMTICPKEAISRQSDDAPVLVDPEKCIGCKFCTYVCPFGVIEIAREEKLAIKCDLCTERTAAGMEPACIEACPTNALKLQSLDEWMAQKGLDESQLCSAGKAYSSKEDAQDTSAQVKCLRCGKPVASRKMLDTIRKKLPEHMTAEHICPECRRLNQAELLADASLPKIV